MLSHQKSDGTTTCLRFSEARHWTKNRAVKTALPSQPTTFQSPHSTPRNFPWNQRISKSASIVGGQDDARDPLGKGGALTLMARQPISG